MLSKYWYKLYVSKINYNVLYSFIVLYLLIYVYIYMYIWYAINSTCVLLITKKYRYNLRWKTHQLILSY